MYKNIKQVQKLKFPLYSLPSNNFDWIDGISFVDGCPVDDLNMKDDTIGLRRIRSKRSDYYKLRSPVFNIGGLIKSKKKHFISSCGSMFTYEKTGFQRIKYHPIKRFELRDTFSFVYIEGNTLGFEIPRPPKDYQSLIWVRMLYYGDFPWIVYEFSKSEGKDTRIKV